MLLLLPVLAALSSANGSPATARAEAAATCNYSEDAPEFSLTGAKVAPTFLPQDAGVLSPAALDGSPYGFYHTPSASGKSTRWTISIQGGGWCYDEVDCYCRSKMHYGTSTLLPAAAGCACQNPLDDGSGNMDSDCNCLFLPYLDGGSFTGFRAEPVPVPAVPGPASGGGVPPNSTVHFRGVKNLDGTVAHALAHLGLASATELVVTGTSAGGLSTFLHADRITAAVKRAAPALTKVAVRLLHPPQPNLRMHPYSYTPSRMRCSVPHATLHTQPHAMLCPTRA